MKKYIFYLIILIIFTGCSKEEIATNPTHDKRVLLSHTALGASPHHVAVANNYQYDTEGLLVEYTPNITAVLPKGMHKITFERDTKKRISKMIASTGESVTFDYDTQNRVVKRTNYNIENTPGTFMVYTYKASGFKKITYNSVGVLVDSSAYIYTPNKKDIATERTYSSKGELIRTIERKYGEAKMGLSGIELLSPESYHIHIPLLEEYFNASGVKTASIIREIKSVFEDYVDLLNFRYKQDIEVSREIRYTYIVKD